MEDYSKLSDRQLAARRARVTDMMKNGSGADMGQVMTLDKVIAQEEARRQKEKPLTRDSDEHTAMDDLNEANAAKPAAGSKKESGGSSEPRRASMMSLVTKTPEEIDTDRLHRDALARSEMGNAVTGPAPADDARGMGGSAVSLGDWTGSNKDYGNRPDGTRKGPGYLGEVKGKNGPMTEWSVGVNMDGRQRDIPSMVPGLSEKEMKTIKGEGMSDDIVRKAIAHARSREDAALPVFADKYDEPGAPSRDAALMGELESRYGAAGYSDPVYGGVSRKELNHTLGSEGMTGQQVWDQAQQERLADYGSAKNNGTPLGQGADFDPYNWDR